MEIKIHRQSTSKRARGEEKKKMGQNGIYSDREFFFILAD